MSTPVTLFVKFSPKAQHYDDVLQALLSVVADSQSEEGCVMYRVHRGQDGDMKLYLYEVWRDPEALAHHFKQPYTRNVGVSLRQWLESPMDVTRLVLAVDPEMVTRH